MLTVSVRQTDCMRVQQTVGQMCNKIENITGSTYWFVICRWAKFVLLLTTPQFT